MSLPFEFVVNGTPVSQQARRRTLVREWSQEVRNLAEDSWDSDQPCAGEVMVTITYFYEGASLDVDNIPKPILDALKGLIYSDDSQVSDLLCRKRDIKGDLRIYNPSVILLESLSTSERFLHIAVVNAMNREVGAW